MMLVIGGDVEIERRVGRRQDLTCFHHDEVRVSKIVSNLRMLYHMQGQMLHIPQDWARMLPDPVLSPLHTPLFNLLVSVKRGLFTQLPSQD